MKRIGATLMEVAMAAAILAVVAMGFALFQTATIKTNQKERDRSFAMQKAIQMMEELKVKAAANGNTSLDDFGQADTSYSWVLTTETAITVPDAPLSDNVLEAQGYRYVRQIWVRPLPRDKGARQVTIRVFKSTAKSTPGVKAGAVPLATLANVFKSMPNIVLPTQQYDIYSIGAHENSLGRWDHCSYPWPDANESYLNGSMQYLASATSGLSMTIRPVRLTSYGRDTYYSPVFNNHDYWTWYYDNNAGATFTNHNNVPLNGVYFRPGINVWWYVLHPGYGQSTYWYNPATMTEPTAPSRYVVKHGNTVDHLYEKQAAYTFADQYNHAVRYHENIEKATFRDRARYFPGDPNPYHSWSWLGGVDPELTLRSLLDDMIAGKRKNAILMNMHGQVFPMIPMRNFSDAAKVPNHAVDLTALRDRWGVNPVDATEAQRGSIHRLVTHPRALEYDTSDVVELRVYPHKTQDIEESMPEQNTPPAYNKGMIVLRGVSSDLRANLATWNGTLADSIEVQACVRLDLTAPNILSGNTQTYDANTGKMADDELMRQFNANFPNTKDEAAYLDGLTPTMKAYRWVRVWPQTGTLKGNDGPTLIKGVAKGQAGKNSIIPYSPQHKNLLIDSVFVQNTADPALGLQAGDVVIKLKNISYNHLPIDGKYANKFGAVLGDLKFGLKKDNLLHQQNYFPDPMLPDLTEQSADQGKHPRNTARFRVLFKSQNPQVVEMITTIGDDPNLLHHQAPNRSRSWVWVGTPAPETERYQLVGDPRHNPYLDVADEKRYNRYFADLDDAYFTEDGDTSWNKLPETFAGYGPNVGGKGKLDFDVPRYFELWRMALLNANAMYSGPQTDQFRIIAQGGEYGEYSPGGVLPHSKLPMTGEKNKGATYDEWKNPTLITDKNDKWYAKPWLGELYPDSEWEDWHDKGNLESGEFLHKEYQNIDGFKKAFHDATTFKRTKHLDHWGPMAFFNATTQFTYRDANGEASVVGDGLPSPTDGKAVSAGLKALLREKFANLRSFTWNDVGATPPDDYGLPSSVATRTTLESGLETSSNDMYYKASDGQKSVAPFIMRRDGKAAYFLGFTPYNQWSGANDPYSIERVYAATMLQGYLDMASPKYKSGGFKLNARIRLLPRVAITQPEDDALVTGANLVITWSPEWTRWDGLPYSRQYTGYGTDGDEPRLGYIIKYSEDGKNWRYSDGTSIGGRVGVHARYAPTKAITSGTTANLNIAGFKNKQYQIRIEAWRIDPDLNRTGTYDSVHHSYSQFSINVAR